MMWKAVQQRECMECGKTASIEVTVQDGPIPRIGETIVVNPSPGLVLYVDEAPYRCTSDRVGTVIGAVVENVVYWLTPPEGEVLLELSEEKGSCPRCDPFMEPIPTNPAP
ncbi:MAG: hypothetical protein V2A76_02370 [Planctomycetota bacterium]